MVKIARKNRYETSVNDTDRYDLLEPDIIKDSIINEVQTQAGSKEEPAEFESVQFEGEIGEGSIHVT